MSVLIKGMEMPTSCEECPLGDSLHCQVLPSVPALWAEYTNAIREKRLHSDCPLVSVPPHGDLIDRDALIKEMERVCLPDSLGATLGFGAAKRRIDDAPVVIE